MNNLILLQQQVEEGSQFIAIGIIAGLILIAPIVIAGFKAKRNLAVYLAFSLFIVGASILTIIGAKNGELNMLIAGSAIGLILSIFLLVFIFKWSKE